MFSSCSNNIKDNQDKDVYETGFITLCLDDSARTVLPNINILDFTDLILKGSREGESETVLVTWKTFEEAQKEDIEISTGKWTFSLTATSNKTTFYGTTEKEITSGENKLFFELSIQSLGDGNGSFSLTVSFEDVENAESVSYVYASLEDLEGTLINGFTEKKLDISNNTVVFTVSEIKAGIYRAKIIFLADTNEIGSYSELIHISGGLSSSAERELKNFE